MLHLFWKIVTEIATCAFILEFCTSCTYKGPWSLVHVLIYVNIQICLQFFIHFRVFGLSPKIDLNLLQEFAGCCLIAFRLHSFVAQIQESVRIGA